MNNSEWLKSGIISVITGCMFAGKTYELIRRLHVLKHAQKEIIVFNPKIDERYIPGKIVSHNFKLSRIFGILKSFGVKNKNEVIDLITKYEKINNKKIDVIAFDEVQFLPVDLFEYIEKWAQAGKIIICAGLDKDYADEYNSLMSRLLVRADNVTKLSAICEVCKGLAHRTQRMKNNKPVDYHNPKIWIGGKENYQARCNSCYKEFSK